MLLLFLSYLLLTAVVPSADTLQPDSDIIVLPVEVLGEDGTIAERTVNLSREQSRRARALWLQVHGVRYPEQASVQVNHSGWIPLRNDAVVVGEPGGSFGGIGGGFATLELAVQLPAGTVVEGANVVRFRFNRSDGLASGYRVLALNFVAGDGSRILPAGSFAEDAPESWTPLLHNEASIRAGRELWLNAPLVAGGQNSPRIQARCADCHTRDGRDLKYFNFSNTSIITRSRFHGLTTEQGEQIASYIRSLSVPNPGRPWNPPYQPGPGIDQRPISDWAAGSGISWVLDSDAKGLPNLLDAGTRPPGATASRSAGQAPGFAAQLAQIRPEVFHPDGNLNPREIPIALQLPDWSQWLPRIHPTDAWGPAFAASEFAALYDGGSARDGRHGRDASLRNLLETTRTSDAGIRSVVGAFSRWQQARRTFLGGFIKTDTAWSSDLADKVYSTQLWQLTKAWEMTQEFELEGEAGRLLGQPIAEPRAWCNTIPADTAPAATRIPNGPAGIGGSALTNEYLSSSWYELQIILNSGNHRHRDRAPVDWVYLIGHFHDLFVQTHQPEPVRLLVAVTKAFQSTDPHLGPDDSREGWRPDQGVDPRIMIGPRWEPMFRPFPPAVRRALTESMLAAWMDKNLQYPIAEYLPLPTLQHDYKPRASLGDITGGRVWSAAADFRAAGVSDEVVDRLRNWGSAYTDRATRLQYH
jgi:hypothetical protein